MVVVVVVVVVDVKVVFVVELCDIQLYLVCLQN